MIKSRGRLRYIFLAASFLFMLQPGTASAAEGSIIVNGSDIVQAPDQKISCGSGSARYDSGTNTLTLENADIRTDSAGAPLIYGIQIERENVTVRLVGENTIRGHFGIGSSHPFALEGRGGGKLTIRAEQNLGLPGNPCRGIFVEGGGLTVSDADVRIVIGDSGDANAYGLYICGRDNRIINSYISVEAEAQPALDISYQGINATDAASLTISDNSEIRIDHLTAGIAVTGNLDVSGSQIAISEAGDSGISCGNLNISGQSDVKVTTDKGVALGVGQNFSISASSVQAESKRTNGILCENFEVTNVSNVAAKGYWPGVYAADGAVVEDSFVQAEATNDVSIFSRGPVTLTSSEVHAPNSIYAHGDISITGGTTEIGGGAIRSEKDIYIGGAVTSDGVLSYDKVEITSGKLVFSEADYSAVDRAVAKAEALNKDDYTNFETVEKALEAVVRGKDIREQQLVDGYATAIEEAIVALKAVPVAPKEYPILEGAAQIAISGKGKSVTIKVDGDFAKFTGVSVDGKKLAGESYTAVSGSTIVTLKAEYIDTLTAGVHTVTFHYSDGQAQTTLTLEEEKEPSTEPGEEEKPGQDETEKPGQDETEKPGQDGEQKPGQGGAQKPGQDGTEKPGQGGAQKPGQDGTEKPGQSGAQKPGQNGTQNQIQKPDQSQKDTTNVSPETGDGAPVGGWFVLICFSAVVMFAERHRRKAV
ncbi:MAG: hypothetical protein HFI63_11050 [Lachnospiraceae bacterium]|nr:hypothetical protein [Lachnospiraceae bacterium]